MTRWLSPRFWWDRLFYRPEYDQTPLSDAFPFTVEEVDRALLRLPELERAVFLNHRLDGTSYEEMAQQMGVTIQEVEAIMASALYKLVCARRYVAHQRRWR